MALLVCFFLNHASSIPSAAEISILANDQVTGVVKYCATCLEGKDVKRDFIQVLCDVVMCKMLCYS